MKVFKPIKALGYPILPLVPECSYCAAMRFALLSATLTGITFGAGSFHFWSYVVIGFWIGLIQVFFLWGHWHLTHEKEGESSE